ncbi:MAG: response regulator [Myxococcota bacterium]
MRLLVIDPDPSERTRVISVVGQLAGEMGLPLTVVEAADGTTALASWEENAPDLVVSEVLLEGVSGLSLLRRKKADAPLPPVVLLTRLDRESDRYWGLRNGAKAYVTKPWDDAQLARRLKSALGVL